MMRPATHQLIGRNEVFIRLHYCEIIWTLSIR